MALRQADILVSNNPSAYGVVRAIEVAGHKTVSNLDALYAIADCILSDSKLNTDSDAIGQTWYVVSEGCDYRLIDWENRKSVSGWEKVSLSASTEEVSQEIENKINEALAEDGAIKDAIDTAVGTKQDKLSSVNAGEGISIKDQEGKVVISCTLDTTIFEMVDELPESADTANHNKVYLVATTPEPEEGEGNLYTEYISVQKDGTYVWEKLGEYSAKIDLTPYLTKEEATSTYLTKTDAEATYVKEADLNLGEGGTVADLVTGDQVDEKIDQAITTAADSYVKYTDIINETTSGGAAKVLSAEQGKVLQGEIDALEALVGTKPEDFGDTNVYQELDSIKDAIETLQSGSGVEVLQSTGSSTTAVMSQNAVTVALNEKADKDVASTSEDGLMSSEDKTRLDGIFAGNLSLPSPTITGTWSFFNNESSAATITPTPDANNPIIEKGYKAQFVGTYMWTHADGRKDPTAVSGDSSWDELTTTGVASSSFDTGVVSTNTTVKISIQAAKTGLMVSGSNVVPASGMDSATATKKVTFKDRLYYGKVTKASGSVTETDIKTLSNELVDSKAKTISGISCEATEYYCYAYPTSLGDISTIIQDGATPVLGAFTKSNLSITNAAGMSVSLNVYVSNNPGAFTGAKLQFQ